MEGTKSENIIPLLQKISLRKRNTVQEITLDLAGNMGLIAKKCFPNAAQVIDRFHVQQLATEALQEIRIKYRWEAIDAENQALEDAKSLVIRVPFATNSQLRNTTCPLSKLSHRRRFTCKKTSFPRIGKSCKITSLKKPFVLQL